MKTALVTGGSSGIGRSTAAALKNAGLSGHSGSGSRRNWYRTPGKKKRCK